MPANPWAAPRYSVSCQEYIRGDWQWFAEAYNLPEFMIEIATYKQFLYNFLSKDKLMKSLFLSLNNIPVW